MRPAFKDGGDAMFAANVEDPEDPGDRLTDFSFLSTGSELNERSRRSSMTAKKIVGQDHFGVGSIHINNVQRLVVCWKLVLDFWIDSQLHAKNFVLCSKLTSKYF